MYALQVAPWGVEKCCCLRCLLCSLLCMGRTREGGRGGEPLSEREREMLPPQHALSVHHFSWVLRSAGFALFSWKIKCEQFIEKFVQVATLTIPTIPATVAESHPSRAMLRSIGLFNGFIWFCWNQNQIVWLNKLTGGTLRAWDGYADFLSSLCMCLFLLNLPHKRVIKSGQLSLWCAFKWLRLHELTQIDEQRRQQQQQLLLAAATTVAATLLPGVCGAQADHVTRVDNGDYFTCLAYCRSCNGTGTLLEGGEGQGGRAGTVAYSRRTTRLPRRSTWHMSNGHAGKFMTSHISDVLVYQRP